MEAVRNHVPGIDVQQLNHIVAAAYATAYDMKARHLERSSEAWRVFVEKQITSGVKVAHRLIKRDSVPIFDTSTCGAGAELTASPQAILQHDLEEWRKIWLRLGDVPTAPWRKQEVLSDLAPLTAEDITRAARSFPIRTSVGCDAVPPAAVADLSDQLKRPWRVSSMQLRQMVRGLKRFRHPSST